MPVKKMPPPGILAEVNGIPVIGAVRGIREDGPAFLVNCPFCRELHRHVPTNGSRGAPCDPKRVYVVVLVDG